MCYGISYTVLYNLHAMRYILSLMMLLMINLFETLLIMLLDGWVTITNMKNLCEKKC